MTAPGDRSEPARYVRFNTPCLPRKAPAGRRPRGFTLLEVVLSIALIGFGVLSLAALLRVLGSVEAEETWDTKALFCAQEGIEELMFDLSTGSGPAGEGEESLADGPYASMWRRWTVASSSDLDGLWDLSVECVYAWKGEERTIHLETMVFADGY